MRDIKCNGKGKCIDLIIYLYNHGNYAILQVICWMKTDRGKGAICWKKRVSNSDDGSWRLTYMRLKQ